MDWKVRPGEPLLCCVSQTGCFHISHSDQPWLQPWRQLSKWCVVLPLGAAEDSILGESVPPRQQKKKIPQPHSTTSCWAVLRAWASYMGMENSVTKHTYHVHTGRAQIPLYLYTCCRQATAGNSTEAWAYAGNRDGITHFVLGKSRDRTRIAIEL